MKAQLYITCGFVLALALIPAIAIWGQEPGPTAAQIPLVSDSRVIVANPSTYEVFVAGNSATLSIVDDLRRTVTDTVTLTDGSANDASVNPLTGKVYVSLWAPWANMNEIDGTTHSVTEINDGIVYQIGVDVNPNTNEIYSLGYRYVGGDPAYATDISIVNGETHAYTLTQNIGGTWRARLVVNRVTNKAYITDDYYNRVVVFNGNTCSVSATIDVQTQPVAIALNPSTNRIYVANAGSQSVSVINGASDTLELHIAVGITPTAMAIDTNSNKIYVANSGSNDVSVIDGSTNNVEATINLSSVPQDIGVHPGLGRVYVTAGNEVAIIDSLSYDVITRTVGSDSRTVSVIEGSSNVYVGEYRWSGSAWVSVLTEHRTHVFTDTLVSLTYRNEQGNATIIYVPSGAVTETTTLVYTPVETPTVPPSFSFAGHAFELDAYRNGGQLPSLTFEKPVTVTLHYSDADVANIDEETLTLQWWNENSSQWEDAICEEYAYDRHPGDNWLAVPVCHLSRFALLGEEIGFRVYLPLVLRGF